MPARLRLNLFSPLPPQQSAIGNHTLVVAAALSEWADVTLWTAQAEPPVLETPAGLRLDLPVVQFDPLRMDWQRLHQADVQIYNIGNNGLFHRAIFDVARQVPGVVVLHDTRLQHFFARYAEHDGFDRHYYMESMRRCHGPAGVADAESWLAGRQPVDSLVERYPMTAAATDGALAAIVHTPREQHRLAAEMRTPVVYLPLAHALAPAAQTAADGESSTLRLIVFGFLGPNRRLPALLDVIAHLPDQDLTLDIYGVLDDPAATLARVAALGLAGRVHHHGFVSAQEMRAALARADLAINLRYPSMGEASASQLRIWEAGLPAVVTRIGWYATLPEDTVFFVEPEREAEDLRAHLDALRRDPERFREAGRRGRAVLEAEHTPERYARGLLDVAAQAPALHARRAAVELSRRAARAMLGLAGTEGIALCAAEAAAAAASLTGGETTRDLPRLGA